VSRRNGAGPCRVVMLLENNPYPRDIRVRNEAESLRAAGYEVTVIAPRRDGEPARETVAGVRVRRFRLPRERHSAAGFLSEYAAAAVQLHLLGALELARGARVVHLHNPPDILFPLAFGARAAGRRVVFDHHDLAPELAAEKFGEASPYVRVLALFERLTIASAHAVLSTNESYRELAIGRGRADPESVRIVRNGPRASMLAAAREPRPGVLDDPRITFVGELEPQDGVDDLPRLLALLRDRHGLAGARLTVIGSGSRRPPMGRAFAALGLGEQVRFTGYVPHARVFELLADADVCVDPAPHGALNDRSTMVKIGEYLAAGRPVVAYELLETTRTAGGAALYAAGGDVDTLAERIAWLARNPAERLALAARARERATELVWEHSERELLRAYARLDGRSGSTCSGAKR
jgi:glycosyltransferase involved in cell wall biosynthesis